MTFILFMELILTSSVSCSLICVCFALRKCVLDVDLCSYHDNQCIELFHPYKTPSCYSFLFFLIFIFTLFYFAILYWFCHTLTWIHHGCTCVPKHEPPSHLLPHIISLDHPRAPAPSILYPVSNIDWWLVSYMIVYMFQCHSPKSSHPLPLPESKSLFFTSVSLLMSCI